MGGIRKDHQSYKIEKNNNKMFVNFSSGKNDGSIEIFDNFYDNLTLQVQIKLKFSFEIGVDTADSLVF